MYYGLLYRPLNNDNISSCVCVVLYIGEKTSLRPITYRSLDIDPRETSEERKGYGGKGNLSGIVLE